MDRNLLSFLDGYSTTEKLIFFIVATIVVVVVVFLIMQFLDKEGNSSSISKPNKQSSPNKPSFNKDYFKGGNSMLGNHAKSIGNQGYSSTSGNKTIQRNEEQSNPTYNDFSEYARIEQEKGVYVRESINEDGTQKTEIDFDITAEEPVSVPFIPNYEYLTTANDGKFLKLLPTDEKSFFRTWLANGIRMFEFHGNIDKALANFNAVFDDVCEIVEGKQNGATQIINDEPGTLDNNLKVEKPAKIKLA